MKIKFPELVTPKHFLAISSEGRWWMTRQAGRVASKACRAAVTTWGTQGQSRWVSASRRRPAKESEACWHQMRVLCKSHVLRTQVATSCGTCILQDARQVFLQQTTWIYRSLSVYLSLSRFLVLQAHCSNYCGGQETQRKRIMTGVTYMSARRDRREICFLALKGTGKEARRRGCSTGINFNGFFSSFFWVQSESQLC